MENDEEEDRTEKKMKKIKENGGWNLLTFNILKWDVVEIH